jgi:hypothetical protein
MNSTETKVFQQTYTTEEIQSVREKEYVFSMDGYPLYNDCGHTLLDLSHLKSGTKEYGHTISVKLPHGRYVTFNVQDLPFNEANVDIRVTEDGKLANEAELKVNMLGFKNGGSDCMKDKDLFALHVIPKKK